MPTLGEEASVAPFSRLSLTISYTFLLIVPHPDHGTINSIAGFRTITE